MKIEPFSVYRDDLKIRGIAYMSDMGDGNLQNRRPTIIMSHGFMANLSGFKYFAENFCKMGYNVYTFNFCCGSDETDENLKSDGESTDLCLESEIQDLTAVYNYVSLQKCVKNDEIYLLGESQGGFVSGLTAARLQEKVKKLIMIFPAVCIPDHARAGLLGGAVYDPKNPPETMETLRCTLGRAFHDDVKDMNPYFELAKYKGETLLIQGSVDSIVVPEYQYLVKDWFDRTDECESGETISEGSESINKKHRLKFQMVRGMDHWTGGDHKDSLVESIKYFIDGKTEILTFRIIVTKVVPLDENDKNEEQKEKMIHEQDVYFTGYCESELFTGSIIEGVDHQSYKGNECLGLSAIYKFVGTDSDGNYAELRVCNNKRDGAWKPEIKTNSETLSWLNTADLYAVVEPGTKGPTIRIYK